MIIGLFKFKNWEKTAIVNYLTGKYDFLEYQINSPLKEISKILGFSENMIDLSLRSNSEINLCLYNLQKIFHKHCDSGDSDNKNLYINSMQQFIKNNMEFDIILSDIESEEEILALKKISKNIKLIILKIPTLERRGRFDIYDTTGEDDSEIQYELLNDVVSFDGVKKKIDVLVSDAINNI